MLRYLALALFFSVASHLRIGGVPLSDAFQVRKVCYVLGGTLEIACPRYDGIFRDTVQY